MAGRRYNGDELQMIATMRRRALSIPAVARQLGRTPDGIQSVLRARHWVDPARSTIMSSVRIFSCEEREAFREFVHSRASGYTPSDIRDEWNKQAATKRWPMVNNERVMYYLCELGLQKTRREYMQCESYRRLFRPELLRGIDVREVVDCRVAGTERRNSEPTLYSRQNRSRVVLRVVEDVVAPQERRDDQGRNAGPRAPLIVYARRPTLAGGGTWSHCPPNSS